MPPFWLNKNTCKNDYIIWHEVKKVAWLLPGTFNFNHAYINQTIKQHFSRVNGRFKRTVIEMKLVKLSYNLAIDWTLIGIYALQDMNE